MKKDLLNETFNRHLGLLQQKLKLKESVDQSLQQLIEEYVEGIETLSRLAVTNDHGDPMLEDRLKDIKNDIIKLKGPEFFEKVDELADSEAKGINTDSLRAELGLNESSLNETLTGNAISLLPFVLVLGGTYLAGSLVGAAVSDKVKSIIYNIKTRADIKKWEEVLKKHGFKKDNRGRYLDSYKNEIGIDPKSRNLVYYNFGKNSIFNFRPENPEEFDKKYPEIVKGLKSRVEKEIQDKIDYYKNNAEGKKEWKMDGLDVRVGMMIHDGKVSSDPKYAYKFINWTVDDLLKLYRGVEGKDPVRVGLSRD